MKTGKDNNTNLIYNVVFSIFNSYNHIGYRNFNLSKKIVIGELLANIVITSLIIVGVFFIFKNATVADSEYNSYLITEAGIMNLMKRMFIKLVTEQLVVVKIVLQQLLMIVLTVIIILLTMN